MDVEKKNLKKQDRIKSNEFYHAHNYYQKHEVPTAPAPTRYVDEYHEVAGNYNELIGKFIRS